MGQGLALERPPRRFDIWGSGGMADTTDLKSVAARREGSSPSSPTKILLTSPRLVFIPKTLVMFQSI